MPVLHRQHSDFTLPVNSFNINPDTYTDAFYPRPASAVDLSSSSSSAFAVTKPQLMSDHSYNFSTQHFDPRQQVPLTLQPHGAFYPQAQQQQQQQQTPREWQALDGSYYNQDFTAQKSPHEQQQQERINAHHRRALSNSTIASQMSGSSYHHNPNTNEAYPEQQDFTHPSARSAKNLPTPSQTPTQDAYMDQQYNRTKPGTSTYPDMASQRRVRREYSGPGLQLSSSGQDFPAMPRTLNGEESEEYSFQVPGEIFPFSNEISLFPESQGSYFDHLLAVRQVPKFDRTMSDIYQDELYNPPTFTAAPIPTSQQQKNSTLLSPYRNVVMNERLQAANQARSESTSPIDHSRDVSPFRQDSPYAGSNSQFAPTSGRIGTVAEIRSRQKAEADARAYRDHHPLPFSAEQKTISPREALLDYPDNDEANASLFPHPQSSSQGSQQAYAPLLSNRQALPANYAMPSSTFNFVQPTVPASASFQGAHDPPKFGAGLFRPTSNTSSLQDSNPEYPAHLVSMETSASESADPANRSPRDTAIFKEEEDEDGNEEEEDEDEDADDVGDGNNVKIWRPDHFTANTGTYTCTYHGCSQRFASPAKLQKHKREGHRSQQGGSISGASSSSPAAGNSAGSRHGSVDANSTTPTGGSGMTSAALLRNSQAGPHRCDRINPSTGKPCSTIFSRPYDLTRHEDTIHNAQKKKVRCQLCTEEKTFSRSDALTRHMRVVHPEVDFPGKHRRRGGGE